MKNNKLIDVVAIENEILNFKGGSIIESKYFPLNYNRNGQPIFTCNIPRFDLLHDVIDPYLLSDKVKDTVSMPTIPEILNESELQSAFTFKNINSIGRSLEQYELIRLRAPLLSFEEYCLLYLPPTTTTIKQQPRPQQPQPKNKTDKVDKTTTPTTTTTNKPIFFPDNSLPHEEWLMEYYTINMDILFPTSSDDGDVDEAYDPAITLYETLNSLDPACILYPNNPILNELNDFNNNNNNNNTFQTFQTFKKTILLPLLKNLIKNYTKEQRGTRVLSKELKLL